MGLGGGEETGFGGEPLGSAPNSRPRAGAMRVDKEMPVEAIRGRAASRRGGGDADRSGETSPRDDEMPPPRVQFQIVSEFNFTHRRFSFGFNFKISDWIQIDFGFISDHRLGK